MKPEEIKKLRKAAGMTQEELAEKCGLATMTIRRYESGKCQPRLENMRIIEKVLGVDNEKMLARAVEDIRLLGHMGEFICLVCAHYNHGEGKTGECVKCLTGDGFRWRGER